MYGDGEGTVWDRVGRPRLRDCMCHLGPPTTLMPIGMRKTSDVSPRRLSDISPQLRQLKYLVVDESIKEDSLKSSRSVEDINSASIEERILRITGYYGYQPWNAVYNKNERGSIDRSFHSVFSSSHVLKPVVGLQNVETELDSAGSSTHQRVNRISSVRMPTSARFCSFYSSSAVRLHRLNRHNFPQAVPECDRETIIPAPREERKDTGHQEVRTPLSFSLLQPCLWPWKCAPSEHTGENRRETIA
ncbi:hypothetical protein DPEC_G00327050 [Dallia pectoralis]|uniref:Uncharacterized protein n=1 Tax=Dallia pectoralis TaxID=75939 RepID=A0ACC2F821_DALPE|nr:hypothetical protein DPEC_G00327050 [Dallia pectoralis]